MSITPSYFRIKSSITSSNPRNPAILRSASGSRRFLERDAERTTPKTKSIFFFRPRKRRKASRPPRRYYPLKDIPSASAMRSINSTFNLSLPIIITIDCLPRLQPPKDGCSVRGPCPHPKQCQPVFQVLLGKLGCQTQRPDLEDPNSSSVQKTISCL